MTINIGIMMAFRDPTLLMFPFLFAAPAAPIFATTMGVAANPIGAPVVAVACVIAFVIGGILSLISHQ